MERTCDGPRDPALPAENLDLGLYLDGELSEGSQKIVEQHLRQCVECGLRLGELREIKASLEDRTTWGVHAATGGGCLTAADVLLTMSGKGSPRAQEHLLACDACRLDVVAIEDSTVEHLAGKSEPLAPDLVRALRSLGSGSGEGLAPIITLPEPASQPKTVKNGSKRLSPKPSKRHAPSTRALPALTGRRVRGRPAAAGVFALVAAAAAAVIVVLVASQSGPSSESQDTGSVATAPAPRKVTTPAKPVPAAPAQPLPAKHAEEKDATEETVPSPAPQGPQGPSNDAEPAPVPAPIEAPAPDASGPTVARGPAEPATPRGTALREPSPLDAPVTDDGARVDLDLSRVAGTLAVRSAGDASASPTADRWTPVARKDGHLSLKPGDHLRSSTGAFISLSDAASPTKADATAPGEAPYDLCLAAKTELVVRSAAHGPVLGLADGRVLCEVEKLTDKHLVIATASGDFECTGTVFSVSADDRKAVCAVEEGTVICRGQAGEPKPVSAGSMLAVARGAAPGEAKPCGPEQNAWAHGLRPERQVVYAATFDKTDNGSFTGETTAEGAFRGVGRSLVFEPIQDNKFWGMSAKAPRGHLKPFRAAADMRLTFSYWLEKPSHVLIQTLCERLGRNYKRDLKTNPANQWITVTIPIMDMETYFDPGKNPVREGDVFTEIEIYAGEPGEHFKALLDDVMIYKKLYR